MRVLKAQSVSISGFSDRSPLQGSGMMHHW
jgi:hypothetical protein